jgi:membrane-associated phospholipid phosphatase
MPSGDAIQSALFAVFLLQLGADPIWVLLFHIGVCLGRVYYMCHWVADTLVATILGSLIGVLLLAAYQAGSFKFVPDDLL